MTETLRSAGPLGQTPLVPEGLERYADSGGTQLVAETAWSFDGAGRLTDLAHVKGAATLADYDWQFDAAGSTRQLMSILRESRHRGSS